MIQHTYERAAAVPGIDRVIVATDDSRIGDAVLRFGGDAVLTSASHASGTDRIAEVVTGLEAAIVVNIQGDLPFFAPSLVDAALSPLLAQASIPMATVKTAIRDGAEWHNPNVVKVVTDEHGFALYFSRSPIPFDRDGTAGDVLGYRHIGVYVYRRDFLLAFAHLDPTPLERREKLEQLRALERGFRIKVAEVESAAIEVDTPQDLERARAHAASHGGEDVGE